MKIPEKIKVGGVIYKVILTSDWPNDDGDDGEVFNDNKVGNVIFIRDTLSPEAQAITLIHEILHCCNTTMNHEFLDSLSEQIYQVFKDNDLLKE